MATRSDLNQQQADLLSGGSITLEAALIANPPLDGILAIGATRPHLTLSPITGTGQLTRGFLLGLAQPWTGALATAVAIAAGFSVTPWVRNPVSRAWYPIQGASIPYRELWMCSDVDACEIYFQVAAASVAAPGSILFDVMEIG